MLTTVSGIETGVDVNYCESVTKKDGLLLCTFISGAIYTISNQETQDLFIDCFNSCKGE